MKRKFDNSHFVQSFFLLPLFTLSSTVKSQITLGLELVGGVGIKKILRNNKLEEFWVAVIAVGIDTLITYIKVSGY